MMCASNYKQIKCRKEMKTEYDKNGNSTLHDASSKKPFFDLSKLHGNFIK